MAQLEFTCPDCGSYQLEEIMVNVTVASRVSEIDSESDELEYGEQTNSDGVVDRYQCENCGQIIAETLELLLESSTLKLKVS